MLFCRFCRKRCTRNRTNQENTYIEQIESDIQPVMPEAVECAPIERITGAREYFACHMARYIGSTVTIFVKGGGMSGAGFTGVLLSANSAYIRLITQPGPAPACALGNACVFRRCPFAAQDPSIPHHACTMNDVGMVRTLGSVTYIPVDKITSFVHNGV